MFFITLLQLLTRRIVVPPCVSVTAHYLLYNAHRIINDRMENSGNGRRIEYNLRQCGGCATAVLAPPPIHCTLCYTVLVQYGSILPCFLHRNNRRRIVMYSPIIRTFDFNKNSHTQVHTVEIVYCNKLQAWFLNNVYRDKQLNQS